MKSLASSLTLPYCGVNAASRPPVARRAGSALSLAMIPLRHGAPSTAFGMLVLASPDPTRYTADMGTEFLQRIGELAERGAVAPAAVR